MTGTLYVVGTPIGNLSDFSPRAVETLEAVDFIAAEDTRVTLKLLNHFGVKKPLVSYFEHNKRDHGEKILARLEAGENCALVSDAGMPAISDPGELLVAQCAERGIPVLVVPGPSAVVSALAISGLPTGRFTFEGFLSVNKKSRRDHLDEVKDERRTMIFYEAPHKLYATLRDMLDAWGDRRIAIVRELTKIHEEVIRTTLSEAVRRSKDDPFKGEIGDRGGNRTGSRSLYLGGGGRPCKGKAGAGPGAVRGGKAGRGGERPGQARHLPRHFARRRRRG